MEKVLYIVRGLPGSGKSSFAKTLSEVCFEADSYFIKDGEYKFDPNLLLLAHAWCMTNTETAMMTETPKIAVCNTFVKEWEFKVYLKLAEKYNYKVFSIILENRHEGNNSHEVPEKRIKEMKKNFSIQLTKKENKISFFKFLFQLE
jgi:predicted kinase